MRNPALDAWGNYDRDHPYPLFAQLQADGPVHEVTLADLKLGRLLNTIDAWAGAAGERFAPTVVRSAPLGLDLRSGEISTIVWATGYRPDLSWLDVPVLDRRGRVVHDGGVMACPGLYLIGMPFLRRRKSSLIDGAAGDAAELTTHLAGHLNALAGRRERSAS